MADPDERTAFICSHVESGHPVLYVSHDDDGHWQFLCGGVHDEDEKPMLVCRDHVLARDPSLNELAEMCVNHVAERDTSVAEWEIVDESCEFIVHAIEEFGWAIENIEEGEAENEPGFAYTIGLTKTLGHPELLIFDIAPETATAILNECGERIKSGETFEDGQQDSEVLERYDVRFHEVRDPTSLKDHVGYALWYYGDTPFRLLQIVWPDKNGLFPGEPRAARFMEDRQPVLP